MILVVQNVPMNIVLALLVLFAAIAAVTAIVAAVLRSKTSDAQVDARRRIRVMYGTAAILGLIFAALALALFPVTTPVPGVLIAVAPSLAGIVFVIAATVGESFWPVPKGQQRGAFLTRRPMFANAGPMWAVITWAVLLVFALVFFGFAAMPDGRSLAHPVWNPAVTGSSGPFPGWPYGIPILICSAVLVALTLYGLRTIARRPAVSGISPDVDAQLRHTSATNLVKGVQFSFAVSLGGVLMVAGTAGSNAGIVDVDGYFATLAGHWWAYPAMTLAVVTIIVATIVAVWKQK